MKRWPWIVILFMQSLALSAAEGVPAASPRPVSFAGWPQWGFALLVVFGAMALFFWMLRRFGGAAGLGSRHVKVLAGVSLGARERVVVVQTGNKQLVLGVCPGRIETLCVLEGEDRVPTDLRQDDPNVSGGAFARQLSSLLGHKEGGS